MAEQFWVVDKGLTGAPISNDDIRKHLKFRYATSLDIVIGADSPLRRRTRMSSSTVRVELLPNGCYDILTLDTIWDKGYKGTYKNFEALPEELQRKVAVLAMLKPSTATGEELLGIGRKITKDICWVYLDQT